MKGLSFFVQTYSAPFTMLASWADCSPEKIVCNCQSLRRDSRGWFSAAVIQTTKSHACESAAVPTGVSIEWLWYLLWVVVVFAKGGYGHVACDFGWRNGSECA
jgi:hypothetical protein